MSLLFLCPEKGRGAGGPRPVGRPEAKGTGRAPPPAALGRLKRAATTTPTPEPEEIFAFEKSV